MCRASGELPGNQATWACSLVPSTRSGCYGGLGVHSQARAPDGDVSTALSIFVNIFGRAQIIFKIKRNNKALSVWEENVYLR